MRLLICIIWMLVEFCNLAAQSASTKPTPYLFSTFKEGTLYYRTTTPQKAKLNYHKVSEEMVMELREHKVPINDIETVDSIVLQTSSFIKIDEKFYEQLLATPMQLLIQHKSTSQATAKTGAYGSKAHTGGVVTPLTYEKPIKFYELNWEDHQSVIDRTEYWVKDGDQWHKANTAKQLASIFPEKKKALRSFISENKLRFDRPSDIKKALLYCLR